MEKCDENQKWALVDEMTLSIPDTFTHRFACHVWQRIFETNWSPEHKEILMDRVHERVLDWKSIGNDENGSLVVQCIFEHCHVSVRKPITEQLFTSTAAIAQGILS
jgi:hypothetical protein